MNLTIKVKVKREKFHELYQTLQALLLAMRSGYGCHESNIYRDVDDGEIFFLSLNWENADQIQKYMRSIDGSALLGAVDLLSESVKVRMDGDSPWEEIEVLKRMKKDA